MDNREYALSIVVPTYNEKDNINALFERLDAALDNISYEVVFVDDSSDNTPDIILELQKEHNNVQLFHRTEEKGLATAVLKGFSLAKGEYISVMDADLQHPPEIIAKMYSAINQYGLRSVQALKASQDLDKEIATKTANLHGIEK